jgi:hypothetical protein
VSATRWHYTPARTVPAILRSGSMRVMACRDNPKPMPFVWFSSDQVIESTACGLWERHRLHEAAGKIARIAVHADYPLTPYREIRGVLRDTAPVLAMLLEWSAKELGADPAAWWITSDEIHKSSFTRIEKWDGASWKPYKPRGWWGDLTSMSEAEMRERFDRMATRNRRARQGSRTGARA